MAGINRSKIHGENLKKGVKSLYPKLRILYSLSNTHKNNPLSNKKTQITKYPISDPKNDLNSLNIIAFISYGKDANLSTLHA